MTFAYLEKIEDEKTLFLAEIDGEVVKGGKEEVFERARNARFSGSVYEINYLKPIRGGARMAIREYSPTLNPKQPWRISICGIPPCLLKGIKELISE